MTHRTAPPERVPSVGPQPPQSTPGASGDDFAAILDRHQARTATAEGQDKNSKVTSREDERDSRTDARPARDAETRPGDDAATRGTEAPGQSAAPGTGADDGAQKAAGKDAVAKGAETSHTGRGAQPVIEAPVAATAGAVVAATPARAKESTVDSRQSAVTTPAIPATPASPASDSKPATPAVPAVPAAPAKAATSDVKDPVKEETPAKPATPVVETTELAKPKAQQAEPLAPKNDEKPVQPREKSTVGSPQSAETRPRQATPQQATPRAGAAPQPTADSRQPTTAPTPTPAKDAPAEPTAAASRQPLPAAGSQPPASPPAGAPATPARPIQQQQTPGVRLSHAAEAVENTIRIAQSRGVTHARLALRPAELGGVEIHLTSTPDGLVARVTADAHQAAQVLQQAGDDLRRQLQAQGIDLQRLDIGVAGDGRHGAGATGDEHASPDGRRAGGSRNDSGEAGTSAETSVGDTIELPDGVLVDVLA